MRKYEILVHVAKETSWLEMTILWTYVSKVTVTTIQSIPEYAMPTQWTFFLEDNDFDEVNPWTCAVLMLNKFSPAFGIYRYTQKPKLTRFFELQYNFLQVSMFFLLLTKI